MSSTVEKYTVRIDGVAIGTFTKARWTSILASAHRLSARRIDQLFNTGEAQIGNKYYQAIQFIKGAN